MNLFGSVAPSIETAELIAWGARSEHGRYPAEVFRLTDGRWSWCARGFGGTTGGYEETPAAARVLLENALATGGRALASLGWTPDWKPIGAQGALFR